MPSLDGQISWITGAGSGIGRATAVALAREGATAVLSGRSEASLRETLAAIEAAGSEGTVEPLDVSDAAAAERIGRSLAERFGRLDILVNCAGINVRERHFDKLTIADWTRQVEVNLNGAYYCCAAVLPQMRRQGGGLIVNVSSWAGRHDSYVSGPAYGASKHGMLSLNASLNIEECRHGIRACAICPGEVATSILDQRPVPVPPEVRAKLLQPEDVAETILFVTRLPPHVCINEILISPTHNRGHLAMTEGR